MARHTTALAYVLTWLALLGLTALTVATSRLDLGALEVPVALAIAAVKAAAVVAVFMHLREADAVPRLVLAVALFYVAVLVLIAAGDVATREGLRSFPLGPAGAVPTR